MRKREEILREITDNVLKASSQISTQSLLLIGVSELIADIRDLLTNKETK